MHNVCVGGRKEEKKTNEPDSLKAKGMARIPEAIKDFTKLIRVMKNLMGDGSDEKEGNRNTSWKKERRGNGGIERERWIIDTDIHMDNEDRYHGSYSRGVN